MLFRTMLDVVQNGPDNARVGRGAGYAEDNPPRRRCRRRGETNTVVSDHGVRDKQLLEVTAVAVYAGA